jgi:hypothetical protein
VPEPLFLPFLLSLASSSTLSTPEMRCRLRYGSDKYIRKTLHVQ